MMRSDDSNRLQGGEDPNDEPSTFKLVDDWIACLRAIERDDLATFLTAPFWSVQRSLGLVSRESLDRVDKKLWAAICRRYATVFAEHMDWSSIAESDAKQLARRVLSDAFALLRSPSERYGIPTVLWEQASKRFGNCPTLKAKYFLRAIVDEVPDRAARQTIRQMAYGIGKRPAGSLAERRERFDAACAALLSYLSSNASSLHRWTDGSVSARLVHHTRQNPTAYIEHLLLPRKV